MNNVFDYNKIRSVVIGLIRKSGKSIDVDEIINDCFIDLSDKPMDDAKFIFHAKIKISTYRIKEGTSFQDWNHTADFSERQQQCICCMETLNIDCFYIHRRYPSGIRTYKSKCKICSNIKNKESLARRKQNKSWLQSEKERQRKKSAALFQVLKNNPKLYAWHCQRMKPIWAKYENNRRIKFKNAA